MAQTETTFGKYDRVAPTTRATLTVQADGGGAVESVAITTGGVGYQVGDLLNLFTGSAAGLGAQFTVTTIDYATGAITGLTITAGGGAGGDNYVDNEVLTDATTTIASGNGFGATGDYYNTYNYATAPVADTTVTSENLSKGSGLTLDHIALNGVASLSGDSIGNAAGTLYKVGDMVSVSADPGVRFVVTTVDAPATGVVTGLALVSAYTTQANATYTNQASVLVSKNQIAPDGTLTAKQKLVQTVLPGSLPKKKVQFNLINGVKVYAEPTVVVPDPDGSNGIIDGNTLRAEDIDSEEKCYAAGYTWMHVTEVAGQRAPYGYCASPQTYAATLGKEDCERIGYLYDAVNHVAGSTACIEIKDLTACNTYLTDHVTGNDNKAKVCRKGGHFWTTGNTCVAFVTPNFGQYVTYQTCIAAGGVFIAGVCYSPAAFGNGQGGDFANKLNGKVIKSA